MSNSYKKVLRTRHSVATKALKICERKKTERKIRYEQFERAIKLLAEKKYPGDSDGYRKLCEKVVNSAGPKTDNTTKAVKAGAVDRLTDTSKYTGSHRERFDESGKGKGLEGRYHTDQVTRQAKEGYVGGYKGMGSYADTH